LANMAPELDAAMAGHSLFEAALASSVPSARVQAKPQAPDGQEDPETPVGTENAAQCTDDCSPMGWALLRTAMGLVRYASNGSHRQHTAALPPGGDTKGCDDECGFAMADSLELGLARETPTDFTVPLRRSRKLWRFRVIRSEDKLKARMVTDAGDFLMYAQTYLDARRIGFFSMTLAVTESIFMTPMLQRSRCTTMRLARSGGWYRNGARIACLYHPICLAVAWANSNLLWCGTFVGKWVMASPIIWRWSSLAFMPIIRQLCGVRCSGGRTSVQHTKKVTTLRRG